MLLVTGGAGYVGSHFIREYLASKPGAPVLVVDDLSVGHREALAICPGVEFVEGDYGDMGLLRGIMSGRAVEAVAHFANSAYVGESQLNPVKYFHNNVVNSLNLFQAMEECGVRRLVFSSSCAIYGNLVREPMDEEHPLEPVNVYGLTKLLIERALRAYVERAFWRVISLRYFNAAGAADDGLTGESHDPEPHILPNCLKVAAGEAGVVEIFGGDYPTADGTCVRDFVHVSDLAAAHCLALERLFDKEGFAEEPFAVFNLGSSGGVSLKELVSECERVTGRPIKTVFAPRRSGDPPRLVADCRRATRLLGWRPRRTLADMIASAWRWQKARLY